LFKCAGPYTGLSKFYRFWKNKLRVMESTKRKLEASEEKWFWSQVLLKWWRHQKQVDQKHFIRSYITRSCLSSRAEDHQQIERVKVSKDLITSNITEDQKSEATTNLKGFESIGCLFSQDRWKRTIVRNVQPIPPLLCLCLCIKTRITAMPATMFLQTRNAFEIDPS